MKNTAATLALATLLALAVSGLACWAEDIAPPEPPTEKIAITLTASPKEVRDYTVDGSLAGPAGSTAGGAEFHYKIRHTYLGRMGDDALPMEISFLSGKVAAQGQEIEITAGLYPKLTVLLDRKLRITDIYGISEGAAAQTQPGINYNNAIILFYPRVADQPRAVGEKWQYKISLPGIGESYDFTNTLKAIQTVDGVKVAVMRQDITRVAAEKNGPAQPAMTAIAESVFAIDSGKLLKSHVECHVTPPPTGPVTANPSGKPATKQEPAPSGANIKIDIALVK